MIAQLPASGSSPMRRLVANGLVDSEKDKDSVSVVEMEVLDSERCCYRLLDG